MISFTSTVVRRCSPKGFSLAPGRFFASSRSVLNQEGKEFDVVVYGASGYTGRLVAEYIQQVYQHHIVVVFYDIVIWEAHLNQTLILLF